MPGCERPKLRGRRKLRLNRLRLNRLRQKSICCGHSPALVQHRNALSDFCVTGETLQQPAKSIF
jgi:hypothetical protein